MNNYKAKFYLKNGIKGEIALVAENDGEAFMTACKMFALSDAVEWKVDKVEQQKRLTTADKITKALDLVSEAETLTELIYDAQKDAYERQYDEEQVEDTALEELVKQLDRALDGLAETKDHITSALKAV